MAKGNNNDSFFVFTFQGLATIRSKNLIDANWKNLEERRSRMLKILVLCSWDYLWWIEKGAVLIDNLLIILINSTIVKVNYRCSEK